MSFERKFQYPKRQRIISLITILGATIPFTMAAIESIFAIVVIIRNNQISLDNLFDHLLVLILFPFGLVWMSNHFQDFSISNEGIKFNVFLFWKIFVPWEDVMYIRESKIFLNKNCAVVTKRLTPFHRIIGVILAFTIQPTFVFESFIPDYVDAVKLIRERTG